MMAGVALFRTVAVL